MKKWQKIIFNVCRIILGIVFIFSSFVKGIDPLGFAYKIHDYFVAAHLPQLNFSSLFLSYTLNGIEFLIGIALILGLFFNYTALATLAFMIFYTILTFILALFNPVSDCGCFGDAIKLTNWETFFKNVILLALIVYVFLNRKKFNIKLSPKYQYITIGIYIIVFYSISFYSYRHLPFFDFMPYSVGSNIKEKMTVPAGMPVDEYQTQLLYRNKNTKEVKSFTLENYPWQDTLN